MKFVSKAESVIAGLLKPLPPLSSKAREGLAKVWPWIALVGGILQLWAAWGLWGLVRNTHQVISYINQALGTNVGYSGSEKFFMYLSIVTLIVSGVLMLMAFPKLKNREKKGWDLIFLATLINAIYSVFNLFIGDRGFGSFLYVILMSALGFYLLFQAKDKFKK